MNKWKRRFREQIHLLEVRVSQYEGIHQQLSNAKQERDSARAHCQLVAEGRDALLAWQRRVREEWKECDECTGYNARLRQAIEAEPTLSDFDRKAYLAQIEKWGKAYEAEPKEGT